MPAKLDLRGKRFGRLTILYEIEKRERKYVIWACCCDCGNIIKARSSHLKDGNIKSCGCFQREKARSVGFGNSHAYKHGLSNTRLYHVWVEMKQRCYNPNCNRYKYYGAKGIAICDEWLKNYLAFRFWAILNNYQKKLTIDRIRADGNYEPNNCQFITQSENSRKGNIERWKKRNL